MLRLLCGRGLLVRSLLQAQAASTTFTNVYAGLVSVVNTKVGYAYLITI